MPRRNEYKTVEDVLRDITDPEDESLRQLILEVVAMVTIRVGAARGRQNLESDDEQTS